MEQNWIDVAAVLILLAALVVGGLLWFFWPFAAPVPAPPAIAFAVAPPPTLPGGVQMIRVPEGDNDAVPQAIILRTGTQPPQVLFVLDNATLIGLSSLEDLRKNVQLTDDEDKQFRHIIDKWAALTDDERDQALQGLVPAITRLLEEQADQLKKLPLQKPPVIQKGGQP